ncbi:hypothetical protein PARPLA_02747 [Rhodobacteraceae bacterium THAF1]|nr:hypothetical protein FIU81_05645 [Palleronia sp. THAF1]VDC28703.1 hypothetical protein PARPLA_02747 [Rhodobacteraceae bacterium THAF1]
MGVSTFVAPDMVVVAPALHDDDAQALEDVQTRVEQQLTGEAFGWSVDARAIYGADVARRIAQTNRCADLAVLAASGPEPSGLMQGVLEAMLYNSRVPVLLVPDGTKSAGAARHFGPGRGPDPQRQTDRRDSGEPRPMISINAR